MRERIALLYTSLALLANSIAAPAAADTADIEAMREGDMKKLTVHAQPVDVSSVPFQSEDGGELTLADYEGKLVLLNFWATWCAPCREEMPALAALQDEYGGEDFEVVTVATGRNAPQAMERFFAEIEVENLPLHTDARQQLAREMGVLGLPVTVILGRDGLEIARLQGGADWASDSSRAIIEALLEVDAAEG